jgi:hypothetical protein
MEVPSQWYQRCKILLLVRSGPPVFPQVVECVMGQEVKRSKEGILREVQAEKKQKSMGGGCLLSNACKASKPRRCDGRCSAFKLPCERWKASQEDGLKEKSFALSLWHVIALRDARDACSRTAARLLVVQNFGNASGKLLSVAQASS